MEGSTAHHWSREDEIRLPSEWPSKRPSDGDIGRDHSFSPEDDPLLILQQKSTLVSALQQTDPVFLIFQYLMNLVPGRSRVPSGRFSSRKAAVMAGATRGHGRFGRLAGSKVL